MKTGVEGKVLQAGGLAMEAHKGEVDFERYFGNFLRCKLELFSRKEKVTR